jgi:hypothetical protein
MDLKKIVLDPGHVHGANVDPLYPNYSEGTNMYLLGVMLRNDTGSPLTRGDYENPDLDVRAERARQLGANTLISLHSDYPDDGCKVFYSLKRPQDKEYAEIIGRAIAQELEVSFDGAKTRLYPGTTNTDYYGIIREAVKRNINHVFIVEHCSHKELSSDTQSKLRRIANVYERLFFNKESDNMTIVIPKGVPDIGAALSYASNVRGAVLDWGVVTNEDDVVQIGGKSTDTPPEGKNPKSFKVISGADRKDTLRKVLEAI